MPPRINCLSQLCAQATARPIFNPLPTQLINPSIAGIRNASILSSLSDTRGAYNKKIRRGRGPASGKGKTSGRGHKGQGQHGKVPWGFEGGQTPYHITHPDKGFTNKFSEEMTEVNLDRLQSWVDQGRLDPNKPITFVELKRSGLISSIGDGIKLLSRGSEHLKTPLHLIVSRASAGAIEAIEAAGGTVTTRFYTKFAIRNIMQGDTHPVHSRLFIPTPISQMTTAQTHFQYDLPDPTRRKDLEYYRDVANRGYLSYLVPIGHSPSLFFKTPGVHKREVKQGDGQEKKKQVKDTENRLF